MQDPTDNPCFIVGPGRSGSTLLYKTLSLHPQIGFLSNYDVRFASMSLVPWIVERTLNSIPAKLNAWFDGSGGAYYLKRPLIKKLVPTPVEGEQLLASCGLVDGKAVLAEGEVAARLSRLFAVLRRRKLAEVLLFKRTALNQSIPLLAKTFPNAKFIYLVRDGRSVSASLLKVEWWLNNRLPWAGFKTPAQLQAEGADPTWIAARNWVAGVEYAEHGLSTVPDARVFKLRYEDFLEQPSTICREICDFLGISQDDRFFGALSSLSIMNRPPSWPRQLDSAQQQILMDEQGELLVRYGYLGAESH